MPWSTGPRVAIAWLLERPAVTSVIVRARTVAQLEDNLGAAAVTLGADEIVVLDRVSDPVPADYPYGGPGVEQRGRVTSGSS